jgi:predicted dienelactone hydrolase
MNKWWLCWFGLMGCGADKSEGAADNGEEDTDSDLAIAAPPDAPGPFAVGTIEAELVGRTGVTLAVQLWYPTEDTEGETHAYDGFYLLNAQDAATPSCPQARPVVAFSHGNQSLRYQSVAWTEHLASHGFVVVAPGHTGNTVFDYAESRLPEMVFRRPLDVSDAVDWLFTDAVPAELGLSDCLDPDAGFAVSGHSFGGYTTVALSGAAFDIAGGLEICETVGGWLCDALVDVVEENPEYLGYDMIDERVWAMIPMAPAGFEVLSAGLEQVTVPALVLGGEWDSLTPMASQVSPIFEGLGSEDKILGEMWKAGHMAFSDACSLADFEDCHPPFVDPDVAMDEINTVSVAFLRQVLGESGMSDYLPNDPAMWGWSVD